MAAAVAGAAAAAAGGGKRKRTVGARGRVATDAASLFTHVNFDATALVNHQFSVHDLTVDEQMTLLPQPASPPSRVLWGIQPLGPSGTGDELPHRLSFGSASSAGSDSDAKAPASVGGPPAAKRPRRQRHRPSAKRSQPPKSWQKEAAENTREAWSKLSNIEVARVQEAIKDKSIPSWSGNKPKHIQNDPDLNAQWDNADGNLWHARYQLLQAHPKETKKKKTKKKQKEARAKPQSGPAAATAAAGWSVAPSQSCSTHSSPTFHQQ